MTETDEKREGFDELVKKNKLEGATKPPQPMSVRDVIVGLMGCEDQDAELCISFRGSDYFSVVDVNFDGDNTPYLQVK